MGLFLGASVVTVFEVLDLIFYNLALRHLHKKDEKKNKSNSANNNGGHFHQNKTLGQHIQVPDFADSINKTALKPTTIYTPRPFVDDVYMKGYL